ncbi:MAG TPA: hypothetical protein VN908_08835 [Gemmatimonadales bacterium]|nr:hypothetical protein [Gemmatimonadales bacterium]
MTTPLLRALGLAPLLAACYTQRPLTTPLPAPATRIVAQLTDSGVVAMSTMIGAGAVEVEGVIAAADATAWDVQLLRVDYRGGASVLWNREQVRFPRYALTGATERRFDKRKSWLTAGVITVSAFLAARLFGVFGLGDNPATQPPPPN